MKRRSHVYGGITAGEKRKFEKDIYKNTTHAAMQPCIWWSDRGEKRKRESDYTYAHTPCECVYV